MDKNKKRKLHRTTVYERNRKICEQVLEFNPQYFGSNLLPRIISHTEVMYTHFCSFKILKL